MKGWRLAAAIAAALVGLTAVQIAVWGVDEPGLRVLVRSSARTSVALFLLAFVASSARTLWRNTGTRWLLANRRPLGVSYAVSHGIHLLALAALYPASQAFADDLDFVTLAGGGLAYVLTFAMAGTSNDASVRALGRSRWRRLHLVGSWVIWIVFAQSYLGRALSSTAYWPAGLLVLAVPALRFAARRRRTRPASSEASSPS